MRFEILSFTHLNMEYQFGHLNGRTYYAQLSSKIRHIEAVFHLNSRLNVPLTLIEQNCTLRYAFVRRYTRSGENHLKG